MKPVTLKPFKIGYDDEQIAFYPRMAWDSEIDEVQQQIIAVDDNSEEKYDKYYELRIQAIADWSEKAPEKILKEIDKATGKPLRAELVEKAESPLDAIKRFFGTRTQASEKLIRKVYNAYLNSMEADISFL